ncbi:MAG: hypothetical protein AAF431_04730 [Pseudomonadota bacterium]
MSERNVVADETGSEVSTKIHDVQAQALHGADNSKETLPLDLEIETSPATVYKRYFALAESGNATAMFILSDVLHQCPWPYAHEPNRMEKLREAGLEAAAIQHFAQKIKACKPLYLELGDEDARKLEDAWRQAAAQRKNPFALLDQKLRNNGHTNGPDENYELLLSTAFDESRENPYLRIKALLHLLSYRRNSNNYSSEPEEIISFAIEHLHCSALASCDVEELKSIITAENWLAESQYEDVVQRSAKINEDISKGNYATIGLVLDPTN